MNANCCRFGFWPQMILLLCLGAGGFLLGKSFPASSTESASSLPMKLLADSSSRSDSISIATGQIDSEFEGLFLLDHESGNLFCIMINPKTGTQVGAYEANVFQAMGVNPQADSEFVMTTGYINLNSGGRSGEGRAANCLCYVAEGKSGSAVAFGLNYSRNGIESNAKQGGKLIPYWAAPFRQAVQPPAPTQTDPNTDANAKPAAKQKK
ncbi:MAG: hypothetical protein R3C03_16205 [Pirellulaceae bacterium]